MTLSLDDVRNKRFRLARKSGYEVAEVDDFLDQVQESFAQLLEENETLKRQVTALGSSEPAPAIAAVPSASAEQERVVVTTSGEASAAVVRLLQMSTEQAERLVAEATSEADRIRAQAGSAADQLSSESHARAERLEAEARERAERLRADAESRAAELDQETSSRREQLFGELERERTSLADAIDDLRQFEQSFRTRMTEQLRRHIEVLESGRVEPLEVPALAAAGAATAATAPEASTGSTEPESEGVEDSIETDPDATVQVSDTPRLDALLGEQR